ncbi:MAG: Gfo/Idh/MocA family oxidoreductase [Oscillospiraceae bacterium]|nr:Gfo/Idh/MocA family oxidoreductase [Oscillospiraceae bacterium]
MSGKLKAAVVGCGGISNWHFSRVKNFEDVEYVGFYDIIKERAEHMAKAKGEGRAFDCYISMLDESKPDILYICVPPDQHGEIELEAIKRGIHMMIDKPISTSIAAAEKICDMATQYNIIISVGFQDRYLDLVDPLREFLAGREIGLVNGAWVGGIPGVYWWRRRTTSGGQVVEQNIHLYDMIRYLMHSEPVTVYTASGKGMVKPNAVNLPGYDVEDYSATAITFKNGVVANIFTGCYLGEGGGMKLGLTFYAKDATIDYILRNKVVFTDKNGTKEVVTKLDQGLALDRVFVDAVKSGKPEDIEKIRSPYFDAIKTLKFTIATNTSIDTGKPVLLNL